MSENEPGTSQPVPQVHPAGEPPAPPSAPTPTSPAQDAAPAIEQIMNPFEHPRLENLQIRGSEPPPSNRIHLGRKIERR